MAFFGLFGNGTQKRNKVKIERARADIQLMTREKRVAKLREIKKNGYYSSSQVGDIRDIYDCNRDLASDFLIYYLLFMDEDIRSESESDMAEESTISEVEEIASVVEEPVSVVAQESFTSEDSVSATNADNSLHSITSEDHVDSSYSDSDSDTKSYSSESDSGGYDSGGSDSGGGGFD
jgi:hypothetical protein